MASVIADDVATEEDSDEEAQFPSRWASRDLTEEIKRRGELYRSAVRQRPACFRRKEWVEWLRVARYSLKRLDSDPLQHYCYDCLPHFKRQQQAEGKCSHPDVIFVRVQTLGEYELVGRRTLTQDD